MSDELKESPVIEEPSLESTAEIETKPVDIDALMNTLEQFDVKSPEKLEGRLKNAEVYREMQSARDQLQNEVQALRNEMLAARTPAPAQAEIDDFQEGKPIDLESLVEKGVNKVLDAREKKAMQHQAQMNAAWTQITSHPKYSLVKAEFEEKLKDPATVMKLQTGQVNPMQFYYDLLIDKYDGMTRTSLDALKQMKGTTTVKAPHVEGQARVPQSPAADVTDKEKKINELREKGKKGVLTDGDQDDLINTGLADFLNT